jgi:hypothetical protein
MAVTESQREALSKAVSARRRGDAARAPRRGRQRSVSGVGPEAAEREGCRRISGNGGPRMPFSRSAETATDGGALELQAGRGSCSASQRHAAADVHDALDDSISRRR